MSDNCRLAVIGAGRVGSALAYLASQKGYKLVGLCCGHFENAEKAAAFLKQVDKAQRTPGLWLRDADLILITTPDDVIGPVCAQIAAEGLIKPECIVAHCSGAHPSSILRPAADQGCPIGSVHPLQSCAKRELAVQVLPGSFFCVEGFDKAKQVLRELVRAIGGRILEIATEDKPIYHAGATVASNFLVGLIHFALSLYGHIGIDRPGLHIQCATEDKGKAQHIIHLIGKITAAGGHDDILAYCMYGIGMDFGIGIGKGEHNRLRRHALDHIFPVRTVKMFYNLDRIGETVLVSYNYTSNRRCNSTRHGKS